MWPMYCRSHKLPVHSATAKCVKKEKLISVSALEGIHSTRTSPALMRTEEFQPRVCGGSFGGEALSVLESGAEEPTVRRNGPSRNNQAQSREFVDGTISKVLFLDGFSRSCVIHCAVVGSEPVGSFVVDFLQTWTL